MKYNSKRKKILKCVYKVSGAGLNKSVFVGLGEVEGGGATQYSNIYNNFFYMTIALYSPLVIGKCHTV